MMTHHLTHWRFITFSDLLTASYIIFLVLFVIGCNHLFTNFVDAKPEGRKTVLGQLYCEISTKRGKHIVRTKLLYRLGKSSKKRIFYGQADRKG